MREREREKRQIASSTAEDGQPLTQLVNDSISLVLDVEELHSSISSEGDVEGEVWKEVIAESAGETRRVSCSSFLVEDSEESSPIHSTYLFSTSTPNR